MASITKRPNGSWRARYRDGAGKEHARHFAKKSDGQVWLDSITTSVGTGTYVDPKTARTTVQAWTDTWITGYAVNRVSTVRQAKTHIAQIVAEFGPLPLSEVRPSMVRAWCARLKADGFADSYVYALHSRLSQLMSDAVHDGILAKNPCSRRTSPGAGQQRAYVATTAQVWAIHDTMHEHLRPAVLLGAFAGLRIGEVSALLVDDVDFMRGIVHPARQWPDDPLKTVMSRTPIPVPRELTLDLAAAVKSWPGEYVVSDGTGGPAAPWAIERAMRAVKVELKDQIPDDFRFHDLRHYLASLLIASGADVKVVQTRLRHASAKTTLDTYGHLWPDKDESTRTAIGAVLAARADSSRTSGVQNA